PSPLPSLAEPFMTAELELLDQIQADAEQAADDAHAAEIDRRSFVFYSIVTAAATTFGFGASALAQVPTAAPAQQPPPAPLPPLGNGEPVSWTFQPYPGGTGALLEKLY